MKHCNNCDSDKNESEFGKRAASPDGLAHKCKQCQREYDKSRCNNQNRIDARKKYAKSEAGIASGNKAKKKWQERNLVKRAAHVLVGNAVRDGNLSKPEICEECKCGGKIHGHHDDYAKPLDVRWLCASCHEQWHKQNGEALNVE